MILSKQQNFSEGQNLTASGASTNYIDLGAPGTVKNGPAALVRDIGKGGKIQILVSLPVAASGTSPTLDVDLEMDDNTSFSSATVVASAPQKAGGAAGDRIALFTLPEGITERYIRLNYTLGGTSPDYTVDAGIVMGDQTNDRGAGVN